MNLGPIEMQVLMEDEDVAVAVRDGLLLENDAGAQTAFLLLESDSGAETAFLLLEKDTG